MISTSGGLNPRAVAGGPSVTRFTQRSCTGIIHSGSPRAAVKNMDITSPTLDEIMYLQKKEAVNFISTSIMSFSCRSGFLQLL